MTVFENTDLENKAMEYIRTEVRDLEPHLVGTMDFALEINRTQNLGFEREKIALAALCHDLARLMEPVDMIRELEARGIDAGPIWYLAPVLMHSVLSAEIAREKIGITDEDVLEAIRKHATGMAEMTLFDKLIFVADKLERGRTYEGVEELREKARRDLVSAYPEVVASQIRWVVAGFEPLDYNSVAAYNEALKDVKRDTPRRNQKC